MQSLLVRLVPFALAGLVAGCGGGGGDDRARGAGSGIVGLYDVTYVYPQDGAEDTVYFEIDRDLRFTTYDYLGDTFDQGPNCYVVYEGDLQLVPLGGDRYAAVDDETDPPEESVWRREGDTLYLSFVDTTDEDDDGDVAEVIEVRFPAVQGLSSADFDECEQDAPGFNAPVLDDGRPLKRTPLPYSLR